MAETKTRKEAYLRLCDIAPEVKRWLEKERKKTKPVLTLGAHCIGLLEEAWRQSSTKTK